MPDKNFDKLREKMLSEAREGIKSSYSSEEYSLIQAINAYMETSKSYNLGFERLSEWYGIYFPEVRISNPKTLASLSAELGNGQKPTLEAVEKAVNDAEAARKIYDKMNGSMGRGMNGEEAKAIARFAELNNQIALLMDELDGYIKAAAGRLLPNTTYLTDHKTAAELLSRAGSMERLATMPAGTIQLLGAEKALFKHIKFGSRPPKYGILFKLPEVGTAQREIRGKIARAYATKICIALKADYFSKNFIAEKLKSDLELGIKRIKEKPIVPKKEQPQERRLGGHGFRRNRRPRR